MSVFLLHAGQAAAGLTLTAASHVFLMEPFMKTGEQAQVLLVLIPYLASILVRIDALGCEVEVFLRWARIL